METIDLEKRLKQLHTASPREVVFVEVPKLNYLMVDGYGDPSSAPQFKHAVATLDALACVLKLRFKRSRPSREYSIMPLEGLWWTEETSRFGLDQKSLWRWTLMMAQPGFLTPRVLEKARQDLAARNELRALNAVRLESLHEGRCAQVLHVGPYATEARTILLLHQVAHQAGYALAGKHHEIYLSDPRRTAPDRMRTILRRPVRLVGAAQA